MMLAVENPGTGALEIAILLDEAPTPSFHVGGDMYEQPCLPHSKLAEAILTSNTQGFAWLFIVYHGDDPATWGSRQVKVTAARKLYSHRRTKLGNRKPDDLVELRYRIVAPDLFHVHTELNKPTMLTTSHKYKAFIQADCKLDPGLGLRVREEEEHQLLGYPEKTYQDVPNQTQNSIFVHPDLGTHVKWIAEKGQGEEWFLQDKSGFENYRFELTEFQRRPFVHFVLAILGFVNHHSNENKIENNNKSIQRRRIMFSTLVRGINQRVQSLTTILLDSLPDSITKSKGQQKLQPNMRFTSKPLPQAQSRTTQRMDIVQKYDDDDDDDDDDGSGSEIHVALPKSKPALQEITDSNIVQPVIPAPAPSSSPSVGKRAGIVAKLSLKGLNYDKNMLKRKKPEQKTAADDVNADLEKLRLETEPQPQARNQGLVDFEDPGNQGAEPPETEMEFDEIEIVVDSSDDDLADENVNQAEEKKQNHVPGDDEVVFEF